MRLPLALVAGALALACLAPSSFAAYGDITTVAGNGTHGTSGEGGPATSAQLTNPTDVEPLANGDFVIADSSSGRIRRVSGGVITTVVSGVEFGQGLAATPDGGFLIADDGHHVIRRVAPDGTITTIAGTGVAGFSGNGGPATAAQLRGPRDVAVAPNGDILIADTGNHRIRKIAGDGTISTVAGNGSGSTGCPPADVVLGDARFEWVCSPSGVAAVPGGGFVIAESGRPAIRYVDPGNRIWILAGGSRGFSGDGGPGVAAQLRDPRSVTVGADGSVVFTDSGNDRIRRISSAGTITTIAGNSGSPPFGGGYNGDGIPAIAALLNLPYGVAALPDGGYLIAEHQSHRVRRIEGCDIVGAGTIVGTAAPEVICGSERADKIQGGGGDDLLIGHGGADNLQGEGDADTLEGGEGNDVLNGAAGVDVLRGGTGDDALRGGADADNLVGGPGGDVFLGGTGRDTAIYGKLVLADLFIDLASANGAGDGAAGEGDDIRDDVEKAIGGGGDDTMFGSATHNVLHGGAGDDTLNGREGADALHGEAGFDSLDAGIDSAVDLLKCGPDGGTATAGPEDTVTDCT